MQYLVETIPTITSTLPNVQIELEGLIQVTANQHSRSLRENQEIAEKLRSSVELTEKFITNHLGGSVRDLSTGLVRIRNLQNIIVVYANRICAC